MSATMTMPAMARLPSDLFMSSIRLPVDFIHALPKILGVYHIHPMTIAEIVAANTGQKFTVTSMICRTSNL